MAVEDTFQDPTEAIAYSLKRIADSAGQIERLLGNIDDRIENLEDSVENLRDSLTSLDDGMTVYGLESLNNAMAHIDTRLGVIAEIMESKG